MNVSTETAIRLGADPVTRAGWRCPGCGVNYSPDVTACHCSALPPQFQMPAAPPIAPYAPPSEIICKCPQAWHGITAPPPCPAHGQAQMMRVTC